MEKQQMISSTEFFFHYVYVGFASKITFIVVVDTTTWDSDLKPLTPVMWGMLSVFCCIGLENQIIPPLKQAFVV